MRFGILQRYVMGEVLRSFLLAIVALTAIITLFMVMAEATNKFGLTPLEIARLVPLIIPSTLPYTIPVALLFAVTVVYGRLAADNEVVAVKTAGLSPLTILAPSYLLGAALLALLVVASGEAIPRATHLSRKIFFSNMEDMFYKVLKVQREFNNNAWPFFIKVRDVEDKTMHDAIFKHRMSGPEKPNEFDVTVKARRARLTFDLDRNMVRVYLEGSETTSNTRHPDYFFVDGQPLVFPLPPGSLLGGPDPTAQELTTSQMIAEQVKLQRQIREERRRQAIAAALWIGSGRINRVDWPHFQAAFRDYYRWQRDYNKLETEKQFRFALACGSLFFALLGAPVGIRFARRDFLSAFITCFLPIVTLYYPLMLMGVNLGKEGLVPPVIALWIGNFGLGILAALTLRPVLRH